MSLIIIPAVPAHKPVVELSVVHLRRLAANSRVKIITPSPQQFEDMRCEFIEVEADRDCFEVDKGAVKALLAPDKQHAAGWYYQQLLKYSAVAKQTTREVLVVDADTVLLSDKTLASGMTPTSKESNACYFEHFRQLFGYGPALANSAITNFMRFEPALLRAMLGEIEARHETTWWQAVLRIANRLPTHTAFSEYETYANWHAVQAQNRKPHEMPINMFRRGDLVLRNDRDHARVASAAKSRGFDLVAFELHHDKGLLRRAGAHVALFLGLKLW